MTFLQQICFSTAQFENFDPAAVECPSDSSLVGYTTIAAINGDIEQEITRIQNGGTPQELYLFVLCPGTTFDTTAGPLLPRLDQATYSCGGTGEVTAGCVFSGGEVNIRIQDPGIDGYSINAINFMGITFTEFTGYSVELLGSAPAEAIFMNCLWQDFEADGIASIANENDPPMDLEMDMCSIQSSSGDPEDAILEIAFDNNGGAMLLASVLVEGIQVDGTFVQTLENGASLVFDSTFRGNSLAQISDTVSGMADFTGVTVSQNEDILLMFAADSDGSSILVENSVIESNTGELAYQIMTITDGAEGSLLNSTIRLNNPVEYGVYVLAETEGTTPMGLIEDTTFDSNIQEDWALVMSEGEGAFAELSRNQFVNNTGGIVRSCSFVERDLDFATIFSLVHSSNSQMNIGAFFGGDIQFTQNCFIRNTHFLVALILEFSEFEASDNYVEDEVSQVCSGEDSEQGPGRLSVEQPGSMCFRGGDSCEVDCLPNINDSPVCLADVITTSSPMPTTSEAVPSPAPTKAPTPAPAPTASPTARPVPTSPPTPGNPTDPPAPGSPTDPPVFMPFAPFFPTTQPAMPVMPICPSCLQPSPPSGPSKPTVRPPYYGPSKPTVMSPTYRPPHHGCKYYGIGDEGCSYYGKHYKKSKSEKYQASQSLSPKKEPKDPSYPSKKSHKSSKDSKSQSSKDGYYYSHSQPKHPQYPLNYGIGGANHYSSNAQHEKSHFGIGYSYSQPRTAVHMAANHHSIGHVQSTGRAGDASNEEEEHHYGIGHMGKDKKGEEE